MYFRQWCLSLLLNLIVQTVHTAPASPHNNDINKSADNSDVIALNKNNDVTTTADNSDVIAQKKNNDVSKSAEHNDFNESAFNIDVIRSVDKYDVLTSANNNDVIKSAEISDISVNNKGINLLDINSTLKTLFNNATTSNVNNNNTDKVPDLLNFDTNLRNRNEKSTNVLADNKPANDVRPDNELTNGAQPDNKPTNGVQPDNKPTNSAQPDNKSTNGVQPDNKPTNGVQPDNELTNGVQPDNKQTNGVQPDNELTNGVQPVNKPTNVPENLANDGSGDELSNMAMNPVKSARDLLRNLQSGESRIIEPLPSVNSQSDPTVISSLLSTTTPSEHLVVVNDHITTPSEPLVIQNDHKTTPSEPLVVVYDHKTTPSEPIVVVNEHIKTPSEPLVILEDHKTTPSELLEVLNEHTTTPSETLVFQKEDTKTPVGLKTVLPSRISLTKTNSHSFHDKKVCETSGKCLPPLNSTITCFGTDLGFSQTSLELSQKQSLEQVYDELEKWKIIENIPACWKVIQPLLCSVYFPRCNKDSVQLVHTNLCKAIKTSCQLVPELNPEWSQIFDCQSFIYSDCKNDEKSERLRFNFTTSCPYPLIHTEDPDYYFSGIEECGMPCMSPLFTDSQYARTQTIISVVGILALISSVFALATFLIDWSGSSKYPAVAIFYINVCCCFSTIGWLIQLGGLDNVVCRGDGTLRLQEPGSGQNENLSCIIVFILIYYFSMAAGVWLVILSYTWSVFFTSNSKVKDLIDPKTAYFHMSAWSIPAVCTIIILAMNLVEADSVYGICFIGYTNIYSRILFLFLPFTTFLISSEFNSWRCIMFLSQLYYTPDYLSSKESCKVKSTLIRISAFSALIALCILVSFLCQIYEFAGKDAWNTSLHDLVICGLKSKIDGLDPFPCNLSSKPNPIVVQVHIISVFLAYLLASSWIYTQESAENWRIFLSDLVSRKKTDRPIKLKKHEMIAQAYGKRRQLEETGRLSLTLHSAHPDPVGIYQEGESDEVVSSDWAAALPYLVQRRGAGCGAQQLGLAAAGTGDSRTGSVMSNSINSMVSSQSNSMWSNRFGWGDSSKLHSVDSQSYNMSDIERLQTIYDETVQKSKKRSKREFFRSHAQKMRPWSRLSRQGSSASGRSTRSSRSARDSTYSESSMNSQILPALTVDPKKLNSRYKRSDYTVPKPGQSIDFGKNTRNVRNLGNTQDPSFRELEEKLKKLADINKSSLNSERDLPEMSQDELATASSKLPGNQDQVATASSKLPGNQDQVATASSNLPGNQDQVATASSKLPGNQDQLATASSKLPGNQDQVATAPSKLPGNQDKQLLGNSISKSIQTSPEPNRKDVISERNDTPCKRCEHLPNINTSSIGTQMTPDLQRISKSTTSKDYKKPENQNVGKEKSHSAEIMLQREGSSTDESSSQRLLESSGQRLLESSSQRHLENISQRLLESSLETNKESTDKADSLYQPLQHVEANVISIKVLEPSSESSSLPSSSLPSSFEKDFKMRKISSSKKSEKENFNIEGESLNIKSEEIEIPVLKNLGSSAGPLIRPKDHYRGRRGAWVEKLSPHQDK